MEGDRKPKVNNPNNLSKETTKAELVWNLFHKEHVDTSFFIDLDLLQETLEK